MKKFKLTKEEQRLLEDIEKGEFVSVKNLANEKKKAVLAAKNTPIRIRSIDIEISEKTLEKIKSKASRSGLSYQVFVSSLLNHFANKS